MTYPMTAAASHVLALLLLATPLAAHEYRTESLTIDPPFTYVSDADTREGYLILVDDDGAGDRLLSVTGEAGAFLADAAGTPLAALEIPAGGAVELLPGGPHIRFPAPEARWTEETEIAATLLFERAGEVPVVFYVEPGE
ncbi:MAG: copper chaperone PCu(A)C [Pseudomonadota bacterium]